eukprot:GHVT01095546.1.p1 GENE.GHVT01095546.1~~GHVT01095546.1.p1  ORF type:complete len:406 (+),score=44.09 GHVT01095546.1:1489-2706(+)
MEIMRQYRRLNRHWDSAKSPAVGGAAEDGAVLLVFQDLRRLTPARPRSSSRSVSGHARNLASDEHENDQKPDYFLINVFMLRHLADDSEGENNVSKEPKQNRHNLTHQSKIVNYDEKTDSRPELENRIPQPVHDNQVLVDPDLHPQDVLRVVALNLETGRHLFYSEPQSILTDGDFRASTSAVRRLWQQQQQEVSHPGGTAEFVPTIHDSLTTNNAFISFVDGLSLVDLECGEQQLVWHSNPHTKSGRSLPWVSRSSLLDHYELAAEPRPPQPAALKDPVPCQLRGDALDHLHRRRAVLLEHRTKLVARILADRIRTSKLLDASDRVGLQRVVERVRRQRAAREESERRKQDGNFDAEAAAAALAARRAVRAEAGERARRKREMERILLIKADQYPTFKTKPKVN